MSFDKLFSELFLGGTNLGAEPGSLGLNGHSPNALALSQTEMGRKLNLSHLSEEECEQILQVIQRDFELRNSEKDRLG